MNYYENSDLEWYKNISAKNKVLPRCPYTSLYKCPIYFQSIALLKHAGATDLDNNEEDNLKNYLGRWRIEPPSIRRNTYCVSSRDY